MLIASMSSYLCSPVPMFFQFDEPARSMFTGVSDFSGFRTLYEIIDLEKVPDRLKTLSGLVEIFKEKIVRVLYAVIEILLGFLLTSCFLFL